MTLTPNCTRVLTLEETNRPTGSATRHNDRYFGVVPRYDESQRREFRNLRQVQAVHSGSDCGEFKRAVLTNTCFETADDRSGKLNLGGRQPSIRQARNLSSDFRKLTRSRDGDHDIRDVGISNDDALRGILGSGTDGSYGVTDGHSRQFNTVVR